jgi:hypothetical protein
MAVEKTEAEKIEICRAYLEKRGFYVGERFMSAEDVAHVLNCSAQHVLNLEIPHANIGAHGKIHKQRRFLPADLTAWIASRKSDL